jgi:hypothetical protein
VAAALVHFLASFIGGKRRPLRHDVEVRRDLEQRIQHQRTGLGDGLLHGEHTDGVIADTKIIALGLDVGVDHLIIEKLRGLRLARNTPVIVVEQVAKERELALLVQHLHVHEVGELPDERLHPLFELCQIMLDLRAEQRLHAVVGELHSQLTDCAGRIAEKAGQSRADAGLRPRAFKDDAIENLDLIQMVALRLEELAALLDGRLHNWIVIAGERYLGTVLFEEVLIDMEAGAEGFERGFQPLHGVLLLRMVQAFVVHAGDTKHHAKIAALGEERGLVPEAVQIDVVGKRGGLFPRLDDFI